MVKLSHVAISWCTGSILTLSPLAIRYFIVNVIVKVSSDEQSLVREKTYLNKLNMVLVQVCFEIVIFVAQ